jgi:hypothetical protein
MLNDSTTGTANIECGVHYDGSGPYTHIDAYIFDNNLSADVTCNMQIRSISGVLLFDGGAQFTSLSGSRILTWNVSSFSGYPYISCTVPPKVGSARSGIAGVGGG